MELKAGMAFAKTKAVIQKIVPQPSQTPHVVTVLSVNLALDLTTESMMKLYMNLMAVWPKTRPDPSIVGMRIPYATFEATPGAEPSAGDTTYCPDK